MGLLCANFAYVRANTAYLWETAYLPVYCVLAVYLQMYCVLTLLTYGTIVC